MHQGSKPGMVPGRGQERHEEPVRLDRDAPGAPPASTGDDSQTETTRDSDQPSALGGRVATRSKGRSSSRK